MNAVAVAYDTILLYYSVLFYDILYYTIRDK